MTVRRICIVTGSRADYSLLYWLMRGIQNASELELQILVTGTHLSPEFGLTYRCIEEDGFAIDAHVEMLLSSDTPVGIAKSIGLGVIGCSEALDRLKPEILLLLGDRFEMLAAAQAALIARIPIAHIAGGDISEGSFDEAIRHAITKMAHLHFVTNELSAERVKQMGEAPEHVFNVGSPGLDTIRQIELLSRMELENEIGFRFLTCNLMVTFHPATLDKQDTETQFDELLTALSRMPPDVGIIFTMPNADPGGRIFYQKINEFTAKYKNSKAFTSLGRVLYLSVLSHVDAVVGNSSSGLYEAPSFKKPTVNIGERQRGRLQANSIVNCAVVADDIERAIKKACSTDCSEVTNPYGDGYSSERIINILRTVEDPQLLLMKRFHKVSMK